MGKLLQFPTNRIIRNSPRMPELSEEEQIDLKKEKFIEQLTDQLSMDILAVLQDHAVKMKDDTFLRDLAVIIESIKSLIYRDFGRVHKMQAISDALATIKKLPDGKQVTDLDYSKIFVTKKPKVDK